MALVLDGSYHLEGALPTWSGTAPLTMACWFRVSSYQNNSLVLFSNNASNSDYYQLGIRQDGRIAAVARSGDWQPAYSSNSYTLNTWHCAVAVFSSDQQWYASLDGIDGGIATFPSTAPTGLNTHAIGRLVRTSSPSPLVGDVACVSIWDESLPIASIQTLAVGVSPLLLSNHSDTLVFTRELLDEVSWPAVGPDAIPVGAAEWGEHPPIERPRTGYGWGIGEQRGDRRVVALAIAGAGLSEGLGSVAGVATTGVTIAAEVDSYA